MVRWRDFVAAPSGSGYEVAFLETDDPRVVAVLHVDHDGQAPDYDAQAPTVLLHGYGSRAESSVIGGKSDVPDAWLRAFRHSYDAEFADRYVSMFYGAKAHHVSSCIDQYAWGVVFDAPDWRADMGIAPETELSWTNVAHDVSAYLDGEVYGIGYAVLESRVTDEIPVLELWDEFYANLEIQCWGYFGDDYAAQAAADFEAGRPNLPTLMPGTEVAK